MLACVALVTVLALAANALHANHQARPAQLTIAGAQLVKVPGATLQVTDDGPRGGDATPIVLIHCYSCSLRWWDRMVPLLSNRHRVVRVDLLGSGGSQKPRSSYSVPEQARLLARVLDRLGVKRPIVVGHSAGFDVAVALAERKPERVRGLVNIGEAPDKSLLDLPAIERLSYLPLIGEALGQIAPASAIKDGYVNAFAPGYDVDRGFENPDQVVEDFRAMTNTSFERSRHEGAAFVAERPLDERVRRTGVRLLVIFGARDRTWKDSRAAARAYRGVPRARIEILRGAGHSPNVERPGRVARLIAGFVRDTDRSSN